MSLDWKRNLQKSWALFDKYYPKGQYRDHYARYRDSIRHYLLPRMYLLDAGCGSEMKFTKEFASSAVRAVGIDIEIMKPVRPGPEAVQGDLHSLPFRDESFDMIISMSVIEHLRDPETAFGEFSRVLKPRGIVILQTPNKFDYVSIISRLTPFGFHQWLLQRISHRSPEDSFPTFYLANTRKKISALLKRHNLTPLKFEFFNQYPSYLMFSTILFRLGVLYERLTSRFNTLDQLRGWTLLIAQKREDR